MEGNKRCSSVVATKVVVGISACGCDWEAECGHFSHVFPPPFAQKWQLRQDTMSLLPPLLARTAMGTCQSKTSAFCSELQLYHLYQHLWIFAVSLLWMQYNLFYVCVLLYILNIFKHFSYSSFCLCCFYFFSYYWTAFTNKSCKYFQTLFLQHLQVGVMVNGFTVSRGLLTLCGLLTCCRWWPVECPAEPGMWRPFGCKAARINYAGRRGFSWRPAGAINIWKLNLQAIV